MLWQVRWNTACHKLLGFISRLSAKEPVEVIWEGKGPFRKNAQCDYKNFVKFNKGQSDLFTASRASWQLLSVFFWSQHRYSTCVTAPGVKLLAEARALGATLSSLNEEMKSSWDEMNLADWPNSGCASPFRAQRRSTFWVFFNRLAATASVTSRWQTKQRRRVFEISDSLSEQSSCIGNFYKMI